MFSFVGDTVLDPFGGTGTTALAASRLARHSISVEVDEKYYRYMCNRLHNADSLLTNATFVEHGLHHLAESNRPGGVTETARRTATRTL